PLFAGTYAGLGSAPTAREAVESSDCLLTVGLRRVELTTGFFTNNLPASAIHLNAFSADLGADNYQAVTLRELLQALLDAPLTPARKQAVHPTAAGSRAPSVSAATSSGRLTQTAYWAAMQAFLRPGDMLIADSGTSGSDSSGI